MSPWLEVLMIVLAVGLYLIGWALGNETGRREERPRYSSYVRSLDPTIWPGTSVHVDGVGVVEPDQGPREPSET